MNSAHQLYNFIICQCCVHSLLILNKVSLLLKQNQEVPVPSALYIGPTPYSKHITNRKMVWFRWCSMLPHTCLILSFKNLLTTNPCRTFTAVISQVTHSPLSALTFQFASYLKKGSSTKWTAFDPLRHLYCKTWYMCIVAPTLLLHLFTRELLVTKWAGLHSVWLGKCCQPCWENGRRRKRPGT